MIRSFKDKETRKIYDQEFSGKTPWINSKNRIKKARDDR